MVSSSRAAPASGPGCLTVREPCVTQCHMKSITIRQLHDETGRWVRRAAELGELPVTERGRIVAKLVPATDVPVRPYFARRKLLPAFRAARLAGGTDATALISRERDDR